MENARSLALVLARLKPLAVAVALGLAPLAAAAQGQTGNLAHFDRKLLHYGIQVGLAESKFDLHYTDDSQLRETLQGTTSYYAPGFHIAMLGDLRLGDYFNLRLLPGVTIVTRTLAYSWVDGYLATHRLAETGRNVESVYGDVPLELKFRARRADNFRPYLLAGASYGFDFASLRKNRNRTDESIVRLQPSDLRYSMGVGLDFFLRYVKFGVEFKMSFGLVDLKVDDPDIYIRSTDDLHSRTYLISFTFEG